MRLVLLEISLGLLSRQYAAVATPCYLCRAHAGSHLLLYLISTPVTLIPCMTVYVSLRSVTIVLCLSIPEGLMVTLRYIYDAYLSNTKKQEQ